MAEQIPYGVAASLINRLASAAFHEFGRIYGVMDELERLKNTVESIRAVLLDVEEKQEQNHAVKIWIRRLKDVLHPADDLLDEFVIEDMRHKVDAGHKNKVTEVFHSLSLNRISFRHKMAGKIEKIRKSFNDVVEEMSRLNLNQNVMVVKNSDSVMRETGSFVLESDIIGRENSKKEIISLLRQPHESQNISSVAIVGVGGLGKTALTQLVYNDVEVQNFFEKRIWVCVSNDFDVKTIVRKMLESLLDRKIDDKLSLDNLQNKLREHLTDKRYLLVLDDIWNESHQKWTKLKTYLMCGARDSKILVTTRSKIVAQAMSVSVPYILKGLTPKESWSLLKNIAFGDDTIRVSQALESIGKKIAEKCGGVPLAIRTLGGLLQNKIEESEWTNVLEADLWESCEDEQGIMPVLNLSYQNLPPQLRQCFAYCSLYPKDWRIEKDELIQMWMAQGYLESLGERHMEDVGNQFVNIFLMKSFFQDVEMSKYGNRKLSFKMHDLMHDLAMQVAGNDCCYLKSGAERPIGRPMHVSFEPGTIGLLDSLDASRLRTLILLSPDGEGISNGEELSIISNFKYLRVLMLWNSSLSSLSGSIKKLKHLRFLCLEYCTELGRLSKSISNLVCLQTLILTHFERTEFSTKVLSKLINLVYLQLSSEKTPARFKKLDMWRYKSMNFLNWLSLLKNIVEISLVDCESPRYLPPLESLPFLKLLSIHKLGSLEYIYYEEGFPPKPFFPSLERLILEDCGKLRGWRRMEDDFNDTNSSHHLSLPPFPHISHLSIIWCPMLTCMPTFPKLEKKVILRDCGVEILEATLKVEAPECSIGFPPLSMLRYLEIGEELHPDVERLPKGWVQNLTSLKDLDFNFISSETFREIGIWFKDVMDYLPSLQRVTFHYCRDLESLPDWMCNLSSLQHIFVSQCYELGSLPEGMPRLTNLQTLEIYECPLLAEECKTETSATWPKIARIPNIIIK